MTLAAVQASMISMTARLAAEPERDVVLRARKGDEEAFRILMNRHRDRAYAIALRITRSPQDADDVVQQAFVRAWHALGRFRAESTFGTWLHRIVARRALDRASELKTRRDREEDLDTIEPAEDAEPLRDVLLIRRLEKLMRRLTAAQRAVVTLFYWEETPVEEIARTLGMPENTVKTHLSRARATLREAWLSTEGSR
jgi:RNA polymerase sigma-70 factor (ECF subfamily)